MKLIHTLPAFLVLLASCAPNVRYDYDPQFNHASLKTFDWIEQPATVASDARAALTRSIDLAGASAPLAYPRIVHSLVHRASASFVAAGPQVPAA